MAAQKIFGPTRIETTGASWTIKLDPLAGFGQVVDVLMMLKVHKVNATGTTTVTVGLKQSPDGDKSVADSHSTPINAVTVTAEPVLLTGYADPGTNGPIGEYLHVEIGVGGGAGEWAVVELYLVKKPA